MRVGTKVLNRCYFTAHTMPASLLVDQRKRMIFLIRLYAAYCSESHLQIGLVWGSETVLTLSCFSRVYQQRRY